MWDVALTISDLRFEAGLMSEYFQAEHEIMQLATLRMNCDTLVT